MHTITGTTNRRTNAQADIQTHNKIQPILKTQNKLRVQISRLLNKDWIFFNLSADI